MKVVEGLTAFVFVLYMIYVIAMVAAIIAVGLFITLRYLVGIV